MIRRKASVKSEFGQSSKTAVFQLSKNVSFHSMITELNDRDFRIEEFLSIDEIIGLAESFAY